MNSDDELLGHRHISELEDAERRLRAHIQKRKRIFRPSTPRRIVGLIISVILISVGLFVAVHAITGVQHHFIKFMIFSGALIVAGIMWIYSDWFE